MHLPKEGLEPEREMGMLPIYSRKNKRDCQTALLCVHTQYAKKRHEKEIESEQRSIRPMLSPQLRHDA
jgi:hypothetical protein